MKRYTYLILTLLISSGINAEIKLKERVVDLRGYYKFEIGDNPRYAEKDFDDSSWDDIFVPSTWEDEGYPGYDGYAWYRIHFSIDSRNADETLYAVLGAIDDVDETYINGQIIGYSGTFPPNYSSQYSAERQYIIPKEFINFDSENVIAVRVFDLSGPGGIVKGKPGIYSVELPLRLDLEISGLWKFQTGDKEIWRDESYDDSDWDKVPVPSPWDYFGYKNYDGFGWYRKNIRVPRNLQDENLILFLGKIDDMDETFFNGEKIGATGWMRDDPDDIELNNNDYQEVRAYYIPKDLIHFGEDNLLAVRVYDGRLYGGIWEGPIGIITRDTYLRYKRKHNNTWKDFLRLFFD